MTDFYERQTVLAAVIDNNMASGGSATAVHTIKVPPGAFLTALYANTQTAFDGTTNTLTISDGPTNLINAVDIKSAGVETAALTPTTLYPSGATFTVTFAQTGTATVGRVVIALQYVVIGRQIENYG
jgi:hypothetical protein